MIGIGCRTRTHASPRRESLRYATLLSLLLLSTLVLAQAATEAPVLEPGILLSAGKIPLSVGLTASVEVVDWNNDRKKDLLVGTYAGGNILLFLNKGTDSAPRFTAGEKLKAGRGLLTVGSG